jgi:hypothetical protein
MNSRQEVLRVAKSRSALRGDFCSFSLGLSKRRRNSAPVCSKKIGAEGRFWEDRGEQMDGVDGGV